MEKIRRKKEKPPKMIRVRRTHQQVLKTRIRKPKGREEEKKEASYHTQPPPTDEMEDEKSPSKQETKPPEEAPIKSKNYKLVKPDQFAPASPPPRS